MITALVVLCVIIQIVGGANINRKNIVLSSSKEQEMATTEIFIIEDVNFFLNGSSGEDEGSGNSASDEDYGFETTTTIITDLNLENVESQEKKTTQKAYDPTHDPHEVFANFHKFLNQTGLHTTAASRTFKLHHHHPHTRHGNHSIKGKGKHIFQKHRPSSNGTHPNSTQTKSSANAENSNSNSAQETAASDLFTDPIVHKAEGVSPTQHDGAHSSTTCPPGATCLDSTLTTESSTVTHSESVVDGTHISRLLPLRKCSTKDDCRLTELCEEKRCILDPHLKKCVNFSDCSRWETCSENVCSPLEESCEAESEYWDGHKCKTLDASRTTEIIISSVAIVGLVGIFVFIGIMIRTGCLPTTGYSRTRTIRRTKRPRRDSEDCTIDGATNTSISTDEGDTKSIKSTKSELSVDLGPKEEKPKAETGIPEP